MKILIFSHENDIDGLGNVVLAKKAFKNVDYVLSQSVSNLEKTFREYLETGLFNSYDRIYITDLALASPSLEKVAEDVELRKKVLVFDHHISSINEGLDKYDFTTIIEEDKKGKRCGSDLFYEHLTNFGLLTRTPILDDFVELTRLEDTWDWKNAGERGLKAHDLAILLNAIGIENYIATMLTKVNSNDSEITFTEEEDLNIKMEKLDYIAVLQSFWEGAEFFVDENGNPYAMLYAEYKFRNEITEFVRSLDDKKGVKYIIVVSLEKGPAGQKSYRSIDESFDVRTVAQAHGGGGHPQAAGVSMTLEQKDKVLTLKKREGLEYLAHSSFN